MARGCWIGPVHRAQALAARGQRGVGFSHGKLSLAAKPAIGGGVVHDAPIADKDGPPVRSFVALTGVTGAAPDGRYVDGRGRTLRVRAAGTSALGEVRARPLVERLSFVPDGRSGSIAFRGGPRAVPTADVEPIAHAMRETS